MDKTLERKLTSLRQKIRKLDSALVAFSGGVDSAFLMRICRDELGEKAVAVTNLSDSYPRSELSIARRVAKIIGVKHVVVESSRNACEPAVPARPNWRSRNVYSNLKSVAMRMRLRHVLDGSHSDDAIDKGGSFVAARRAGVKSPLLESDLTKAEIRLLAKELGLPNWDRPSSSSLKCRKEKKPAPSLSAAKKYVGSLGRNVRLRVMGKTAYILVGKRALINIASKFSDIRKKMRALGFSDVMLKVS